ncbi:MAG: class I SAM-dependent methyltransferase [candidate division WWE3 bacterium]|nr:class I SAM-dependent methyltransferase [candidate division WWE3 bacterium]
MDLADYDSTHFNYQKYWTGRDYENLAEQQAIKKLVPKKCQKFIDVGGGFGRNLKDLLNRCQSAVLLDYSTENLTKAREFLKDDQVTYVRGDVYKLPFPDNSFDSGMMIRVMHHLEEPELALKEIYRVMAPGSTFILEFANKNHFKALLKHGRHFAADKTPYNQLTADSGVFLNFHPEHILKILNDLNWKVVATLSVSNFRSPVIKKIIPGRVLSSLDNLVHKPLGKLYFGPSIFIKLVKTI